MLAVVTAVGLGCGSDEPTADTSAAGTDVGASPTSSSVAASSTTQRSATTGPSTATTPPPGGVEAAPESPAYLVPDDEGTFSLAVGARTSLRLDRSASEPELEGDAVELVRVAFESDPGYVQYDIVGRERGEATMTFDVGDTSYEFTFVVT